MAVNTIHWVVHDRTAFVVEAVKENLLGRGSNGVVYKCVSDNMNVFPRATLRLVSQ